VLLDHKFQKPDCNNLKHNALVSLSSKRLWETEAEARGAGSSMMQGRWVVCWITQGADHSDKDVSKSSVGAACVLRSCLQGHSTCWQGEQVTAAAPAAVVGLMLLVVLCVLGNGLPSPIRQ